MTVIFSIQHPAHVHLFRNAIKILSSEGHEVSTLVRKKDINLTLLDSYNINYTLLAGEPSSSLHLPFVQLKYEWGVLRAAQRLNPDLLIGVGEPSITHAATLSDARSLVFTDTEHATLQNLLAFPFADRVYTPECYQDDIGDKQVRYPGYHELAYLHPNRFDPDPSVLTAAGVDPDEQFVVLRLVSWDAMHDVGESGFRDVRDVVRTIEATGARVLITSEADLPAAVEDRRVRVDPQQIHHLLAHANLYLGESSTMATESAILGTPSVFVNSNTLGYTDELAEEYGLVFSFSGDDRHERGLSRALELLETDDPERWARRRRALLQDKIDTTSFIVETVRTWLDRLH